jgi:hypothetical protein
MFSWGREGGLRDDVLRNDGTFLKRMRVRRAEYGGPAADLTQPRRQFYCRDHNSSLFPPNAVCIKWWVRRVPQAN